MLQFDSLIFADWPRGLYLAKQLALTGQKIAYVECLPRLKNPFPILLNEKPQQEFLESLGFLSQQKGGFCLLSPEGIWPMQEMKDMRDKHIPIKNFTSHLKKHSNLSFKNNWLSYLSLNLSSKTFKDNNSIFTDRGIKLLADCFLFEPSSKKIQEFKRKQSNISFWTAQEQTLSFKKQVTVLLKDKALTAQNFFCLSDSNRISAELKAEKKPTWQWQACYLTADFFDYKKIIPSHFLFIKNIYLPWCYDNFLSVFYQHGTLEIWMKLKPQETSKIFFKQAKKHLTDFFKGSSLKLTNKAISKSIFIYDEKSLNLNLSKQNVYIETGSDFFHGDLASELLNEQKLFKKAIEVDKSHLTKSLN